MDKTEIKAAKSELRKRIIGERSSLTEESVREMSEAICRNMTSLPEYDRAEVILGYYSTRKEPVLDMLFEAAIGAGKKVYLPKVMTKETMEFFRYESEADVAPGSYGIMEPVTEEMYDPAESDGENILMIMPGVAFDEKGNRIGYGGGYYDRYLERLGSPKVTVEVKTVMAAYNMQKVSHIPTEATDMRPDKIITEVG